MFGIFKLFKRKPNPEGFLEGAAAALKLQIEMGLAVDVDGKEQRLFNSYGRGYMFGWFDLVAQIFGNNDDVEGIATMTAGHAMIFNPRFAGKILGQSLREQGSAIFEEGRHLGRIEFKTFVTDGIPARGLWGYISNVAENHANDELDSTFPKIEIREGSNSCAGNPIGKKKCNRCGKMHELSELITVCPNCWPSSQ